MIKLKLLNIKRYLYCYKNTLKKIPIRIIYIFSNISKQLHWKSLKLKKKKPFFLNKHPTNSTGKLIYVVTIMVLSWLKTF